MRKALADAGEDSSVHRPAAGVRGLADMDRRAFVRGLVVGAVILCWPSGGAAQEPSVTFRAETSLIEWACGFYGPGGPVTHLTEKSFSVVLDKKVPVAVTVLQPTPGSYHVYFSPPDNLRDGKKHRVDADCFEQIEPSQHRNRHGRILLSSGQIGTGRRARVRCAC